jgi:hypothetical protein
MAQRKDNTTVNRAKEYVAIIADYEGNGYDVFAECYGPEEWEEFINGDDWLTVHKRIDEIAKIYSDRQHDAENSAF